MLALTGCQDDSPSASPEPEATALPQTSDPVALDPADFSPDITNRYWPMAPGTRWTYREVDEKATWCGWSSR